MMVLVVCAAVIRRGNKLLVTQRRRDQTHPLRWEFPGGQLDRGETEEACVRREIKEELGILLSSANFCCTLKYQLGGKRFVIHYFLCKIAPGRIKKLEIENFKWILPGEFDDRVLLPPDRQVLRMFRANQERLKLGRI